MTETTVSGCQDRHCQAVKLFQEGNYKEAARILDGVLKDQATSEIWNDWATAKWMCGQVFQSERGYRCALSMDPANARAAGNLGVLLASTGRIPEALPLLEQAAAESSGKERDELFRLIQTFRGRISSRDRANGNLGSGNEDRRTKEILSGSEAAFQPCQAICAVDFSAGPANQGRAAFSMASPFHASAGRAGVYFKGHFYGGSGYAEEAWAEALGVSEREIPVQLVPVGDKSDTKGLLPEESRCKLEKLQRQTVDLSESVLLQFAVARAWDMETYGRWCVVRTMFETDRLPDGVSERCSAMDEIWVPSRFNLETYARAGVEESKLRLVPPGVDTHLFSPGVAPLQIPRKRGFNFLSILDWQQRKGYDALLHAYLREFKADEDVALVLKVTRHHGIVNDLQAEIAYFVEREAGVRLEKAPPIILINGFVSQSEMPRLYASADCFVLPTRGEGYGRPFLEALSCQVPVIATGWGGQTDFLSRENSYLLDYRLTPVPDDVDIEVFAGHRWADPDVDHLRRLMRHVFSHKEEAFRRAERGRAEMVRQYDWSTIIPCWVAEFRRLLG
ncbi:MAG: glycosyltransferase [Acidobacteriota bacterium]